MDLNKVMVIGNLTRDPEIRNVPSGDSVANLGIATNRVWTDNQGQKQQAVEYHNVVAWRKLADICGQYLKKGDKVYIEGRLQTRNWEGQDGIKRYRTEIIARDMIMLTPPGSRPSAPTPSISPSGRGRTAPSQIPTINVEELDKQKTTSGASAEETKAKKAQKMQEEKKEGGDEEISIEDIPF